MFNRCAGGGAFCHASAVSGAQSLKYGTTLIAPFFAFVFKTTIALFLRLIDNTVSANRSIRLNETSLRFNF